MKTVETAKPASASRNTAPSVLEKAVGHDFFNKPAVGDSFFPAGPRGFPIQRKLTIGEPDDMYEKEADAMADKVVQRLAMPDVPTRGEPEALTKPLAATITPLVQTKCAHCEQEEKMQMKEEEEPVQESPLDLQRKPIFESNTKPPDDDPIQRKCAECEREEKVQRKADHPGVVRSYPLESKLSATKGGGSPLPETTRGQMENSFGADFSSVRVHSGSEAVQLSRNLNAQAFTHGHDIYFGEGKYNPGSVSGQRLLAHELTHVVQQNGGGTPHKINRKETSIQRALSKLCNAPSHWGMPPSMWITIGTLAHLIGTNDYLTKTGGRRGVDVYFDTFELLPIDPRYAGFIIRNNPGLASWKQVFLSVVPLKRPDYMIHRPGLTEFDELKPLSIPGVIDGVTKIHEIAGYMSVLGLPYHFGTSYTPTRFIPLFSTSVGGVPVNVSLKFERLRPGLIVYELCIETDWSLVVKTALIALIILLLILLLRRLPIPEPLPVPPELPAPVPVPVPVPAPSPIPVPAPVLGSSKNTVTPVAPVNTGAGATTQGVKEHGDLTQVPEDVRQGCSIETTSSPGEQRIPYTQNSSSLNAVTRRVLNNFAREWHRRGGNETVRIDGYASTEGGEALNWRLSCSRSQTVARGLENPSDGSPGIPTRFITIHAHGETNRFSQTNLEPNRVATLTSSIPINPNPPTPPVPPPTPPADNRVCGPDVTAEVARVWRRIQSDFNSWGFGEKEAACRYLIQPIVPNPSTGKLGLNIDAFDTLGLFLNTAGWTQKPPYHPPCGVPGSLGDPCNNRDPLHEDPDRCCNTVKVGPGCWLTGTANYGTYGVMMKLCSDWVNSPLAVLLLPPALQQMFSNAFSFSAMVSLISAYKLYDRENPTWPVAWSSATYLGGPSGVPPGSNRPTCRPTCNVGFRGLAFDYVWEPTKRRPPIASGYKYPCSTP